MITSTDARRIATALDRARTEAIKRGHRVNLCKSADGTPCADEGDWSGGWILHVDAEADLAAREAESMIAQARAQAESLAQQKADALITEVARVGTTRVISRTTILRYKGTHKTIKQIGRELNIDAVVEGTILRSGNSVRITAQLIQVATDNHLWAQTYERDATEVLRLQQEVAADIARRIGSIVTPVEPLRTVNPDAYGEYLKGRFYFYQYSPEGWQRAIEHYGRAIQADPSFAPAHSGLAESYIVAWAWNALPTSEDALRKGKEAAQKALELDPMLASAHLALGESYDQEWEHDRAEKELRRAVELNPSDPLAWQLHGTHFLYRGDFETGIAEQERARMLDPFSPIINANLARAFCYSRQYDNLSAVLDRLIEELSGSASQEGKTPS